MGPTHRGIIHLNHIIGHVIIGESFKDFKDSKIIKIDDLQDLSRSHMGLVASESGIRMIVVQMR